MSSSLPLVGCACGLLGNILFTYAVARLNAIHDVEIIAGPTDIATLPALLHHQQALQEPNMPKRPLYVAVKGNATITLQDDHGNKVKVYAPLYAMGEVMVKSQTVGGGDGSGGKKRVVQEIVLEACKKAALPLVLSQVPIDRNQVFSRVKTEFEVVKGLGLLLSVIGLCAVGTFAVTEGINHVKNMSNRSQLERAEQERLKVATAEERPQIEQEKKRKRMRAWLRGGAAVVGAGLSVLTLFHQAVLVRDGVYA